MRMLNTVSLWGVSQNSKILLRPQIPVSYTGIVRAKPIEYHSCSTLRATEHAVLLQRSFLN